MDLENLQQLVGRLLTQQLSKDLDENRNRPQRLQDAEFRVFSQFGDDGIIQFLIRKVKITAVEQRFVEFGTQDYTESNTRFLLINDNWSGLIMDPSTEFTSFIKRDQISWRHDLKCLCCFVTPENLNTLIRDNEFDLNLGLLSIDIDGMDYWVWKSLEVSQPVIVVSEFNSVFGPSAKVTVPYQEKFNRTEAHTSNLYWGASLNSLVDLAEKKGYSFVGCNSAGNNAYFIRNDRMNGLKALSSEEGYVESKFRESRDVHGNLTFIRGADRLKTIGDMPIWDIQTESKRKLGDVVVACK